ncbi:MAG TPA: glycosyltransferase family 1 protein [Blastocatellia bacterium]|nr:glycosyltransferase family 1 protein [Blastocatellia bacterium]
MAKILLNALASTAGGGTTYLRNVLPRLGAGRDAHLYLALVPEDRLADYSVFASERLRIETVRAGGAAARRFLWEQTGLRRYLKAQRIDLLISLGNFALFASPVPQILFNRNDLYFSDRFVKDLKARRLFPMRAGHHLKSWLARRSIRQATLNLTPTRAFADRILASPNLKDCPFEVLPFGFNLKSFTASEGQLPDEQLSRLNLSANCRRLLYVSHYNYYRNFETLIRALPIIKARIREEAGQEVQLVLTTEIRRGARHGEYDATAAAELIDELGLRRDIAMLGGVPYHQLHLLYRLCEVSICPSYAESFGHPLVEAMAMGLPVVAADLPVHREVCRTAAVYFEVLDERALAEQCLRVLNGPDLRQSLRAYGLERSQSFSWDRHARELAALTSRVLSH